MPVSFAEKIIFSPPIAFAPLPVICVCVCMCGLYIPLLYLFTLMPIPQSSLVQLFNKS